MKLASWNVRTLLDLRGNSDRPCRRTALVAAELRRYNIDIAALSETRLLDEGSLKEEGMGYTFFLERFPSWWKTSAWCGTGDQEHPSAKPD